MALGVPCWPTLLLYTATVSCRIRPPVGCCFWAQPMGSVVVLCCPTRFCCIATISSGRLRPAVGGCFRARPMRSEVARAPERPQCSRIMNGRWLSSDERETSCPRPLVRHRASHHYPKLLLAIPFRPHHVSQRTTHAGTYAYRCHLLGQATYRRCCPFVRIREHPHTCIGVVPGACSPPHSHLEAYH